jgi:hypothetical protein
MDQVTTLRFGLNSLGFLIGARAKGEPNRDVQ